MYHTSIIEMERKKSLMKNMKEHNSSHRSFKLEMRNDNGFLIFFFLPM